MQAIVKFSALAATCVLSKLSTPTNPKNVQKFFAEFQAATNNGSSYRSNPIDASNMSEKLPNYGCWCTQVYTNNGQKGRPIDELDEVCRQWAKCKKCEVIEGCEGELDLNYSPTLAFDMATFTLVTECLDMNECTTNRCECDLFHIARISEIIATGDIDDSNSGLGASDCHHAGGVDSGAPVQHACCGAAPTWKLYDQEQYTCNAGELTEQN
jgi:hypothetical protein